MKNQTGAPKDTFNFLVYDKNSENGFLLAHVCLRLILH